ncbi:MAG: YihY/virulence factor BrkB family protein [Acetobacteraceae bacterium]|nr:YihY/virulence factor BrkB family protein [Acetobacteraceae bacterium]
MSNTTPNLPGVDSLGRGAESPEQIPWRGWRQILHRTYSEMISDRISMVASGCAFWATLALFPAISMLVSLYGLAFDPQTVEPQLATIRDLLPPAAYTLIAQRIDSLVRQGGGTLGLSLVLSTLFALWSTATGTKTLLTALNMAYEEEERRSLLHFQLVGVAMTATIVVGAIVALAILVTLPFAIDFVGLGDYSQTLIKLASVAVLVIFVLLLLSFVYRFGPCRRKAKWKWVTPGSVVATLLWLLASLLFSLYVGHLANYDSTYGPLGAVAAVMMWFWVSAYAVLLGAELNSEMELQTVRDSTEGPPKPMGARGAYVADHVASGDTPAVRHEDRQRKAQMKHAAAPP